MEDALFWIALTVILVVWSPIGKAIARAIQTRAFSEARRTAPPLLEEQIDYLQQRIQALESKLEALEAPRDESIERKLRQLERRIRGGG